MRPDGTSRPARALLLSALKSNNPDIEEYPEDYCVAVAAMLAEELEGAPQVAKRVRSLAYNLTQNHELRRDLLSEAVSPSELCAMGTSEWASASVKRAREAALERSEARMRFAATGGELFSRTSSVRCPECGGSRARFKHLGTDLKDWHGRKNEVWGTKQEEDDGLDCLIVCSSCGHEWHGTAPEIDERESGGDSGDDLEQSRRKDLVDRVHGHAAARVGDADGVAGGAAAAGRGAYR